MQPSGGIIIPSQGATQLVHPGILHTQDDFMGMRKLIDRWEGIGRDYEAFDGVTWAVPAVIPVAPPVKPTGATVQTSRPDEITPRQFYESLGLRFFDKPGDSPIAPEVIAEYREERAGSRRMYAEWRAYRTYLTFRGNAESTLRPWTERQFEYIGRDGVVSSTKTPVEQDFREAYFNAVNWVLTGDKRHAQKAFRILDSYARHLKGFQHGGYYDHMLMVGLQGQLYAATAEILRYAHCTVYGEDSGYIAEQFHNIDKSIREVWLKSVIEEYINIPPWRAGNQGAMIIAAYVAISIYLDDLSLYNHAIDYFLYGHSCGNMKDYIHHYSGQVGEATRTQAYVMLALSKIILSADMAWRQGTDVFGAYDNALWRSSEYACRYNMGDNNVQSASPVPFDPYHPIYYFDLNWEGSVYGREITQSVRGAGFEAAEIVYNHYFRRRGMPMPWTEAWIGIDGDGWHGADSPPGYTAFLSVGAELARELGL